jgi:hypothetical protein
MVYKIEICKEGKPITGPQFKWYRNLSNYIWKSFTEPHLTTSAYKKYVLELADARWYMVMEENVNDSTLILREFIEFDSEEAYLFAVMKWG